MVASRVYDFMYRTWAPWNSVGVRQDLVWFLDQWNVTPSDYPRTVDLGCGTGANVVHLADLGFESWGVDFSTVALQKAARRAEENEVEINLVEGDLTSDAIPGLEGIFDLLVDFGTLDDLRGTAREAMARSATCLAKSGTLFLLYCFYGARDELPWLGMTASKLSHIEPGEIEELFGGSWEVEMVRHHEKWRTAVFVLTRR